MAKSKVSADAKAEIKNICQNRKASFQYELGDRLECGMVLTGTEVKSLRAGQAGLEGAYARIENGEIWLHGCEIAEYAMGNQMNHLPKRPRKLLLHRAELARFAGRSSERGFTLVPTRLYFKGGKAKVEIAIGRGKKLHDKRQAKKTAEATREIRKAMKRKRGD
ncbi:MAG: SsrA-binding protein SmpB [Gemmataceae bacterium]|nr:SsrA-binding protein SmpB [Gemmataceae bacterium]